MLDGVLRGSDAVAAGRLTASALRGHRYRRLLPDVYAPAELDPDLALRARAGHLIAIEHEGADHFAGHRVARDVHRYTRLVDLGWRVYRYTANDVYQRPARIVAEITRALGHNR
ncbi:MAG TPA: DUF559 domain-containing protein [Pseudonocardia sp.]|nr:DUF559 domain-containing protein [Pseudonocardia sp.]